MVRRRSAFESAKGFRELPANQLFSFAAELERERVDERDCVLAAVVCEVASWIAAGRKAAYRRSSFG